jgi:hypothetical protein
MTEALELFRGTNSPGHSEWIRAHQCIGLPSKSTSPLVLTITTIVRYRSI